MNYRFNWPRAICDYVLIWIYKECTSLPPEFKFPQGFLCHPVDTAWEGSEGPSHCPRIVENMILSSLIYSSFLDYWLDMSYLILAWCSRHLWFASLKLAIWGISFASLTESFIVLFSRLFKIWYWIQKQQTQNSSPSAKSHRDFRETAALASQSW